MIRKKIVIILLVLIILVLLFGVFKIQNTILKIIYKTDYKEYVYKYSKENDIDPLLTYSIIKAESNFNVNSVSKSGAIGLMQLMESTAKEVAGKKQIENFKKNDLYEPEKNIMLGTAYFKELLHRYDNNLSIALIAYNAGIGVVDKWIREGIIKPDGSDIENVPYKETNMYVRKILRNYKIYKEIFSHADIIK